MSIKKKWKAALYIRLSQEDEKTKEEKLESNSIINQKVLLHDYVENYKDIEIFDTYIDD